MDQHRSVAFLLMLCLTGLPLIFHDEVEALEGVDYETALSGPPSAEDGVSLHGMLAQALSERPGEGVLRAATTVTSETNGMRASN